MSDFNEFVTKEALELFKGLCSFTEKDSKKKIRLNKIAIKNGDEVLITFQWKAAAKLAF